MTATSTHSLESLGAGVEDAGITDAAQTGLDLAGSMTPLQWLRPSAIGRIHTLQSKWLETGNQRSFRLFVNASNQIQYDYSDDGTAVRTAVSAAITGFAVGAHFHLGAVFISGTPEVQFYLNGLAFGSPVAIAGPGTVFDSTADYRLGNFDGGAAADNFRGQMDEVKLYSDERTATEIRVEFQEPPVSGASLVAGYSLDNILTDISGGANTLVNNGTAFNEGEVHGFNVQEQKDEIAGTLAGGNFNFFNVTVINEAGQLVLDTTPPVITNFSPAINASLDATDPVTFDVIDETALRRVAIFVSFADGSGGETVEMVHDGDSFRGNYLGVVNLRTSIANGFRFTILRDGGWIAAPKVEFLVVDQGGNEGVIS